MAKPPIPDKYIAYAAIIGQPVPKPTDTHNYCLCCQNYVEKRYFLPIINGRAIYWSQVDPVCTDCNAELQQIVEKQIFTGPLDQGERDSRLQALVDKTKLKPPQIETKC